MNDPDRTGTYLPQCNCFDITCCRESVVHAFVNFGGPNDDLIDAEYEWLGWCHFRSRDARR